MTGLGLTGEKRAHPAEHVQIVAFYERDTGRIRHMHMSTTIGNAARPTKDQVIADAKSHASRRITNLDALEVALSNDVAHARHPHRIDPSSKKFVRVKER